MIHDETFRYNWFETNVAQFLFKYDFPIEYKTGDFLGFIQKYQDEFLYDFDSVLLNGEIQGAPIDLYNSLKSQKDFIAYEFEEILCIIRAMENSQLSLAERKIEELLDNIASDYLITTINNLSQWNPELYRVRIAPKGILTNKMELFHVPYHLHNKVSNERYNFAGKPCLYLSTSLNLAWRECGCPKNFYYADFKYKYLDCVNWQEKEWKFLSFLRPRDIANRELCSHIVNDPEKVTDFLVRYFRTYPIVFACSIINQHKSDPYKPEYIIPQLVAQWIERNHDKIRGILYFPCTEDNALREYNGYNIALPTYNYNEAGYSSDLVDKIEINSVSFSSNTIAQSDKELILALSNKLQGYIPYLRPIADSISNIRKTVSRLRIVALQSDELSSEALVSFIESILDNCKKFNQSSLEKIIVQSKSEDDYQLRFDTSIVEFSKIYNTLLQIIDNIDHYHLYLERGYPRDEEIKFGE